MVAIKICYLVLLPVLLLGCLLSGSQGLLALLTCCVLLPVVFLICNLVAAKRIYAKVQLPANLKKGQSGELILKLENRTIFPVFYLQCCLQFRNKLNGQSETKTVRTFLRPRGTQEIELTLGSRWCGRVRVEAEKIRLYDCFGLIPVPVKQTAAGAVTVQPDTFEQTVLVSPDANCPDDSETYSQERPGYDLTETFQIRDYQIGDSMRQIHWKLSNKFDRLIIRDPSLPVTRSVVVFWDRAAIRPHTPQQTDAQAEVVVSACRALTEQAISFTLAWNDTQSEFCVMQEIRDMEELIGVLPRLLSVREKVTQASGAELFAQTAGEKIFAHILYVCGDLFPGLAELERLGRVTALICSDGSEQATCFDPERYREQLMEIEI